MNYTLCEKNRFIGRPLNEDQLNGDYADCTSGEWEVVLTGEACVCPCPSGYRFLKAGDIVICDNDDGKKVEIDGKIYKNFESRSIDATKGNK